MVRRHVREGYGHIARQCEIIAELRASGHSVVLAEALLATFQSTQSAHEAHLARITTGHGDPPADRLTDLAAGDTSVGSTPNVGDTIRYTVSPDEWSFETTSSGRHNSHRRC
jgi:hypothetical protein